MTTARGGDPSIQMLETTMRRDDFLKLLAGTAVAGAWPLGANAAPQIKIVFTAKTRGGGAPTRPARGPAP
ncbi:MAG: hypothetical protein ACOVPA_03850, partial [Rubrivivax sp.]